MEPGGARSPPDRGWPPAELLALIVCDNHLNGDWARQDYYRPSWEEMARMALYEWGHVENFNGVMGQAVGRVDLTGTLNANPIPTFIMGGKWSHAQYGLRFAVSPYAAERIRTPCQRIENRQR